MDQEHRDFAEPESRRRWFPLWGAVLAVVAPVALFLVIFFGDEVDEWLGAVGLRKWRD